MTKGPALSERPRLRKNAQTVISPVTVGGTSPDHPHATEDLRVSLDGEKVLAEFGKLTGPSLKGQEVRQRRENSSANERPVFWLGQEPRGTRCVCEAVLRASPSRPRALTRSLLEQLGQAAVFKTRFGPCTKIKSVSLSSEISKRWTPRCQGPRWRGPCRPSPHVLRASSDAPACPGVRRPLPHGLI